MSIIKSIEQILGSPPSAKPEPEQEAPPAPAPGVGARMMTVKSYAHATSEDARSHTFELRYAAFGEKSNMVCAVTRAASGAVRPDTLDNALHTSIDMDGRPVASCLLVMDGRDGLAADDVFADEIDALRAQYGDKLCEVGNLMISRANRSRRALGAMFHVLYLYARQARQLRVMVLQARPRQALVLARMMGFKTLAKRGQRVLMSVELDFVKKEQRQWGGTKEEGAGAPYLLYPFFFPAKDEAGLLLRVLAHLGTNYGAL